MYVMAVDRENLHLFENLAPAEWFSPFDIPGRYRLGVVDEENGNLSAAGVLVFDVREGEEPSVIEAVLQWLYISEEFRCRGAADALMQDFFDVLYETEVDHLVCELPMENEYDILCAYLEAWEMQFTLEERYESTLLLGEMLNKPFFRKKMSGNVLPLSACPEYSLRRSIRNFQVLPAVPEALESYLPHCDQDVSCVSLDKGQIKGLTLVRKLGDESLELLLFRTLEKSPAHAQNMLLFAGLCAEKKYSPQTPVRIVCRTEGVAQLITYFLPTAQPRLVRRGVLDLFEEEDG